MKAGKVFAFLGILTLAGLFGVVNNAYAQQGQTAREYVIAQAIEQVSGTILRINHVSQPNRPWTGTHILLQTPTQNIDVSLGPTDYVENQGVALQAGDQVVVTGVRSSDGATMLAYSIQKGNQTLRLRAEGGVPLWAGGRRR